MITEFIKFAGVGAIGTIFHYLTLISLVSLIAMDPVNATSYGFAVGAVINYYLNYIYTFKSRQPHLVALPKFLIVALIGAGINMAILYWGIILFSVHYLLIQLIATGTVLLWNYLINRTWTYAVNKSLQSDSV